MELEVFTELYFAEPSIIGILFILYILFRIFAAFSDDEPSFGNEMGALQCRVVDAEPDDEDPFEYKEIQLQGLFPNTWRTRLAVVSSLFDTTEEEWQPVISHFEVCQEPESVIYRGFSDLDWMEPGYGFPEWIRVGIIIPESLQPPTGGHRTLTVVVRLIDQDDPPPIQFGWHDPDDASGLLWGDAVEFHYTFEGKGYSEESADNQEARALAVQLAIAVAMADGVLDDSEGYTIKDWITRMVAPYDEERQDELKTLYNDALRDGHKAAVEGRLSLSDLTGRLNEIGDKPRKYEAIKLCIDVMAADGVADAAELSTNRQVAEALELDIDEVAGMRDQAILTLGEGVASQASIEDVLGIDPGWNARKCRRHLRSEFQKWNNRLNALPAGEERDQAQRMIDLIGEARKNYE